MSGKKIDLNRLRQNLQKIELRPEAMRMPAMIGHTELEQAYHLSAAVLTTFDPWQLKPFGAPQLDDGSAVVRLLANCTPRYDAQGRSLWTLNHSTRKKALP